MLSSSKFLFPRVHVLVDFTVKTTSGYSDFCVGVVRILLHVVKQGTSLLCFFFLFKVFP